VLRLAAVAAMAAGLGGCIGDGLLGPSGPTAPERLDATMGMDEHDVIRRWGPPDDSYEFADGGRSATWEYDEWNSLYEDYLYASEPQYVACRCGNTSARVPPGR
jgi:hypothetical protein